VRKYDYQGEHEGEMETEDGEENIKEKTRRDNIRRYGEAKRTEREKKSKQEEEKNEKKRSL
jgi:hypothetical protein